MCRRCNASKAATFDTQRARSRPRFSETALDSHSKGARGPVTHQVGLTRLDSVATGDEAITLEEYRRLTGG
jgi:hypothetical protein